MSQWAIVIALALPALFVAAPPGIAENGPAASLPAVTIVRAEIGEIAHRIRVTGSLVARRESVVTVDLQQGARIDQVLAEVGDDVIEGQVLARLDDTAIRIELDVNAARLTRAEAAIRQAEAQIADAMVAQEEALSSLERGRKLKDRGVTASDAVEKQTYAARRAATSLDMARQNLDLAKADRSILATERRDIAARLERVSVRAPVAGRILKRTAKVGALVGSGSAELFVVAAEGEIEMAARVPQMDFLQIPQGAEVEILVPGVATPLAGQVRLIEPAMQANGRQGLLRIAITAGADTRLPTGAFARGEVAVGRHQGVLLPASAVLTVAGQARIQIVEDGVVASRDAVTGMRADNLVEIVSGVEAGETIVLKAGSFLASGDRVHPVDASDALAPPDERPLELALEGRP